MDVDGKDASNVEPSMPSEWQVNGKNLRNTSIGMIQKMVETSACSSGPMIASFCPPGWDHPIVGYGDVCQNDASTSTSRGDIGWMPRGSMFLPTVPGVIPQSLPHFPDSAFIERAARFSCFSGGNLGEVMNPFSIPADPIIPYSRGVGLIQGPQEFFSVGRNVSEVAKEGSQPGKHGSPVKKSEPSNDGLKRGAGNESDEAEFSGRGGQEELDGTGGESSGKGKRKRGGQITDNENNSTPQMSTETGKEVVEMKRKGDQNPTSTSKANGKNGKQGGSQGSDTPKEEYIHVRARRGQATNSHSLAERVRREKISERMKFLQDLVPGCSKVTGKAVMLDEIINYVQSLQRQVEFLSMKLATVNPRLDFNIEGFLTKDILQPRTSMSSSLGFPPDMTMPFPQLHHPSPPGLILPANSSEALGRPMINLQSSSAAVCGGSQTQVPGVWEDELHNVVHMGFNSNSQDLSGSRHMKTEP